MFLYHEVYLSVVVLKSTMSDLFWLYQWTKHENITAKNFLIDFRLLGKNKTLEFFSKVYTCFCSCLGSHLIKKRLHMK